MGKEKIKEKLNFLQKEMELEFKEIRSDFKNPGNKGENVEEIVRSFIKQFLPPKFRVGRGEIIDSYGNISKQTDVIIIDEHHPFLSDLSKPSVFFIEGVACVGEVKSILTTKELEKALENCKKFKELNIKELKGSIAHTNPSDRLRFLENRAYFLFVFESKLSLKKIWQKITEFIENNSLGIEKQIGGIFILDKGVIINFGDGKGQLQFTTKEGKSMGGLIPRDIKKDNGILLQFLMWLSSVMPKRIVFSPIIVNYLFDEEKKLD